MLLCNLSAKFQVTRKWTIRKGWPRGLGKMFLRLLLKDTGMQSSQIETKVMQTKNFKQRDFFVKLFCVDFRLYCTVLKNIERI